MNKKLFKYETKNHKKIRPKDILTILSVLCLCVITVIVTTDRPDNAQKSVDGNNLKNNIAASSLVDTAETISKSDTLVVETDYLKSNLPELQFVKPVDATVIKPFSTQKPFYSETMDDWRIHPGVDLACNPGTEIRSAERGVVKTVEYDINYGNTVVIMSDEYTVTYSSLSSEIPVFEGQEIAKGDLIGTSAETCMIEICDEPHIHLEMKKNGEYVDPMDYIHFN